jgi:transportin-1
MLSCHFGDDLLPIIVPIVQQRLGDANWRARESGKPHALACMQSHACSTAIATLISNETIASVVPAVLRAAILALGAVSNGCATGLAPFLPEMVAMLLPTLKDPRPMVRCIR